MSLSGGNGVLRIYFFGLLLILIVSCGASDPDSGMTGGSGTGGSTNTNTSSTNTNAVPDLPAPGTIELGTPVLPYTLNETRDTAASTNDSINSYAGFGQDESGPEYLYRFSAADWVLLNASVSGMASGVDIDLHLCRAADDGSLSAVGSVAGMVIARHDSAISALLPAGIYYLIADTYLDRSGSFDLQLSLRDVSSSVSALSSAGIRHATNDTAASALDVLDSYSGYAQDESGPEQIYPFVVGSNCTFTAGLYDIQTGSDIDLHLLAAGPYGSLVFTNGAAGAPIARHDIALRADLAPGSYFLIADSYMDKSGSYSLRIGFRGEGVYIWDSFVDPGRTLTEAEVPTAVSILARSIDCLSADRLNDYLSVVCPPEHRSNYMASMSGCALTGAFIWRALGIYDSRIWDSYVTGTAVWNLHEIGNENGCLRSTQSLSMYPGPGHTVDIATSSTNNDHHIFVVSSEPVLSGSTLTFRAIHGGQVTGDGKQLISEKVTTATWTGSAWDVGGRKIIWWVETEKIPRSLNARLPADTELFF